jgi:uncharacterized protein with HEPN domain
MTREQFIADEKTQDAVTKCAEAIGTAAGEIMKLEPQFDSANPALDLKAAYNARNRLSHGYHSIDYVVLWNTATISVPAATRAAERLLLTRGQ